ncbi:MAG: glycosyltransferase family 4 protein [Armatimonadetes bacterium]|nr:glycosyltransferase family 4 protein [Armatimonadota bacterium]
MVGTHVPRRCGIATFTADLSRALMGQGAHVDVIAVDDDDEREYGRPVTFRIREDCIGDYRDAARWVNEGGFDAVCLQHEFGIFGGTDGRYVLEFLRMLECPVVTTLHTVLEHPTSGQREVFEELGRLSDKLVTMSRRGMRILRSTYDVPLGKGVRIPHGTPTTAGKDDGSAKHRLGLDGKKVLLTFGLLSPDKGIEDAIEAMPDVVREHPEAVYIVAGATHPHVKARHGESYRQSLLARIDELQLTENVRLEDTYLSQDDLIERLQAADVVILPYRKKEQITSGVLSVAFASGNAIVSTSFWHAEELLDDGRGELVGFKDPQAIGRAVVGLLDDAARRKALQTVARSEGAKTRWSNVAATYLSAIRDRDEQTRDLVRVRTVTDGLGVPSSRSDVPGLKRLLAMTDDVGLLQHAKYTVPLRQEGYCVDDNARALWLLGRLGAVNGLDERAEAARGAAFAFVVHAFDGETKRFRNFMSYGREWTSAPFSEDADGRSVAALASVMSSYGSEAEKGLAEELLRCALSNPSIVPKMRGAAQAVIGLSTLLEDDVLLDLKGHVSRRTIGLHTVWRSHATSAWPWFEDAVTYEGARLCQALIDGGRAIGRRDIVDDGLTALHWLVGLQQDEEGRFSPIGSEGFYPRGGRKAVYDQQPVEAWATVDAAVAAHRATGDELWRRVGGNALAWFWGANAQGVQMVDPTTGGAYDGLRPDGPNQNQGAESTLSLLGSHLASLSLSRSVSALDARMPTPENVGVA